MLSGSPLQTDTAGPIVLAEVCGGLTNEKLAFADYVLLSFVLELDALVLPALRNSYDDNTASVNFEDFFDLQVAKSAIIDIFTLYSKPVPLILTQLEFENSEWRVASPHK